MSVLQTVILALVLTPFVAFLWGFFAAAGRDVAKEIGGRKDA